MIDLPDYYQILRVDVSADLDAIKKAYRQLATQYHPDKNKAYQADFALINEAYQVLKDPIKRQNYDKLYQQQFGVKYTYSSFDTASFWKNIGEQFGRFVKTAENHVSSSIYHFGKKPHLITIDLKTALLGGRFSFEFFKKTIKVTLPKGLYPDVKIKLMIQDVPVWFKVDVSTPKNIVLDKKDIHLTQSVDIWQIALGEKISIEYENQALQIDLSLVDVTKPIVFTQKGIPALNDQKAGDLYLYIVANLPNSQTLTDGQRQAFLALKESFDHNK